MTVDNVDKLINELKKCDPNKKVAISVLDSKTDDIHLVAIEFVSISNDPNDDMPVCINTSI